MDAQREQEHVGVLIAACQLVELCDQLLQLVAQLVVHHSQRLTLSAFELVELQHLLVLY
jgi:hypothetical protein